MTVPYRCNRAVIFVSDQYHESLPFRFAPGKGRWCISGGVARPRAADLVILQHS